MPGEAIEHWLAELGSATCAVPFEHLGLHERSDGPGIVLRVWQPDCEWVEVVDRRQRKVLGARRSRSRSSSSTKVSPAT